MMIHYCSRLHTPRVYELVFVMYIHIINTCWNTRGAWSLEPRFTQQPVSTTSCKQLVFTKPENPLHYEHR